MTAPFVSLHVTPDAEGFAAPRVRTLEGFLPGVAVAVDLQAARAGEGLLARRADVSVLHAGECCVCGAQVMVMLPGVSGREEPWRRHGSAHHCGREVGWQWPLMVHPVRGVHHVWRVVAG